MDEVENKTFEKRPVCLLADNGSRRPEAILALRRVAVKLAMRTGLETEAVGLLHSDEVKAESLCGLPGETVETCLRRRLAAGEREFLIVPFFLGPSRALTKWLLGKLEGLRREFFDLRARVAPCLAGQQGDGEEVLAEAVAERVRSCITKAGLDRPFIAFTDHGSPAREVWEVRERVGELTRRKLSDEVLGLRTCSMERRPGEAYDFNEPLLEKLLFDEEVALGGEVVVARFFLSPGRHAGEGGDLDRVQSDAEVTCPGLRIFATEPLGEHPLVLELLSRRTSHFLNDAG